MLSWLSKKPTADAAPAPAAVPDTAHIEAEWQARLQAAQGDDAALLLIAQGAPLAELQLAAIEALQSEEALKHAERDLREHERRVHRAAKQRLNAAVAQREARAAAQELIHAAAALMSVAPLPANRLVAIDQGWQALSTELLAPTMVSEFNALREHLNATLRDEAAQEQQQREQQREQQRLQEEAAQAQATQAALAAQAEQEAAAAAAAAAPDTEPTPRSQALNAEQKKPLQAALDLADAALAEGHLNEMHQHLQAFDGALEAMGSVNLGDTLRTRRQALHAEWAQLKDWAQWGGRIALEALLVEAEALARLTTVAGKPGGPKLAIKSHGEAIHSLRTRWKEIDRLGTAASRKLWLRFDAALQTAHQPVAAHQAALKAARLESLAAREALLATLEAVPPQAENASADDLVAHWKAQQRALDQFQLGWRQLGPLEHTVPSAARAGLQERMRAALERVEAPLQQALRAAEAQRERLIARAEALGQAAPGRDTPQRVRELQAEWQHHARTLTLARGVERALWGRFKAATDAVFTQRQAAFSARDAELAANLAAREALIAQLEAIAADTPESDIRRTLADADRAWRQVLEVPRGTERAIDTRFHAAHQAAQKALAGCAQLRWHAQCDALAAKLALCEEREAAGAASDDLSSRWAAQTGLPTAWEQALAKRWAQQTAETTALDELLLQLEAALDLPASAEQQAARRELKLRAMKATLEGRSARVEPAVQQAEWFATVLRSTASAAQRERVQALIAALRQAAPGTLGGAQRAAVSR